MEINLEGIPQDDVIALDSLIKSNSKSGMSVVELGTYTGMSSVTILPHILRNNGILYCVDWFKGMSDCSDEVHRSYKEHNILDIFLNRIKKEGYDKNTVTIVGRTDQVAAAFSENFADIIFIDADHRYSCTRNDILRWWPKLKKQGVMCGHDFKKHLTECNYLWLLEKCEENHDFDWQKKDVVLYGVTRAVCEFFKDVKWNASIWHVRKEGNHPLLELALRIENDHQGQYKNINPIIGLKNVDKNMNKKYLDWIEKGLENEDDKEHFIISAASILWSAGLESEAFMLLKKTADTKNDRENILVLSLYAFLLYKIREYEKAISILQRLSLLRPQDPIILNKLGESFYESNELEKAEQCFSEAIQLDDCPVDVLGNLGSLYWRQGKRKKGFFTTEKAFLHPKGRYNIDIILNLANMNCEIGRRDNGIQLLENYYAYSYDNRVLDDLGKLRNYQ